MKKLSIVLSLFACLFGSIGAAQNVTPVGPMVTYEIKAPNGKTYEVQARQDASQLEIAQAVVEQHPEANIAKPAAEKIVTYKLQAPNGKVYKFEGPVGATHKQQVDTLLRSHPEAAIAKPAKSGVDLSKMSDTDLDAIVSGNMAGVSEAGRRILAAQPAQPAIATQTEAIQTPLKNTVSNSEPVAQVQVPEKTKNLFQDYYPEILWVLLFVLGVLIFAGPILGAFALGRRHHRLRPECRPFAWGYYNALSSFLAPLFIAGAVRNTGIDRTSGQVLLVVLILMYFTLAILTLRRSRLGFLLLTILSLNPIFWVINGIYLKNRWNELSSNAVNRVNERSDAATPPSNASPINATSSRQAVTQSPAQVPPGNRGTAESHARFGPPDVKVAATAGQSKTDTPQYTTPTGSGSLNDETLYEQALAELSTSKKPGLWAMALAQTANGGNPDGAYIALRVEQLRGERSEQQQSRGNELSAIARDSHDRLIQQSFFNSVEATRQDKEASTQFIKHYQALVQFKNSLDAKKLVWLCEYEILNPGDDPSLPNSYIVRRSAGNEPVAVLNNETALVEWAVSAFAVRHSTEGGYL